MEETIPNKEKYHEQMDWTQIKQDREDYFEKLRKWLNEARLWHILSSNFPNPLPGAPFPDGSQQQNYQNPYALFYQNPAFGQNVGFHAQNNPQMQQFPNGNTNNTLSGVPFYQTYPFIPPPNLLRLPTTFELKVPPVWKRVCAELIDFCILFTLKLILTFLFMESFSIGNALDLYGLDLLQKGLLDGQELNFPLAFELVLLEFLHRFVVCLFETYFLRGKTCATPGKRCMGLMVVNIENVSLIPNRPTEVVSATGVKPLGWQRALIRSILKNLIVGLLLPLCVTFHLFPYKRTSYDMMANTFVVEAHPEFLLYQNFLS
ncbi:protein FAM8A1 [Dendroctonus ponderosae]